MEPEGLTAASQSVYRECERKLDDCTVVCPEPERDEKENVGKLEKEDFKSSGANEGSARFAVEGA